MFPFPGRAGAAQGQRSAGNPVQAIISQAMRGFSPAAIVDRIGGPQARQAREIISGKNQSQLRDIAMNMARQRGVDLDSLAQQLGVTIPK
jgi:hypothetical protein